MIGNSFSICVQRQMPQIAQSMGLELDLASLYIGGCSLERHVQNVAVAATNAAFRPYRFTRYVNGVERPESSANIPDALKAERWDVVTIQQASHQSWRPETYQPFADSLCKTIKKLAPQAEIVLQETWSYTPWDARLAKWGLDQNTMYAGLHRAYHRLAAARGLRVIPVGTAVQLYRDRLPVAYGENDLGGDPCGAATFSKDADGRWKAKGDVFHLNGEGHFLQALVWTAKLFGVDVTRCAYAPEGMSAAHAELMRKTAMAAVRGEAVPERRGGVAVPQDVAAGMERLRKDGVEDGEIVELDYLPGRLRVGYVLRPSSVSYIRCELALPDPGRWNGRLWGFGNGGWAGTVGCPDGGDYAGVKTDLGTSRYARSDNPVPLDVIKDFSWRATHLMTVTAKRMIARYYGRAPAHCYFRGASTGGGQGLCEAQRFPEDYDGIIAEVPGNDRLSRATGRYQKARLMERHGGRWFTAAEQAAVREAELAVFARTDPAWARGRFIVDPRPTPAKLDACWKEIVARNPALADREALWRGLFQPVVVKGRRLAPGQLLGIEFDTAWTFILEKFTGPRRPEAVTEDELLMFADEPNHRFVNPDLSAFKARGGRLLMYAGLEDVSVPAQPICEYYDAVVERMGGLKATQEFFLHFLEPGRAHSPSDRTHALGAVLRCDEAIVDWVEKGIRPETLSFAWNDGSGRELEVAPYPDGRPTVKERACTAGPQWITGAYEPPAETNEAAFFAPAPNPIVRKTFRAKAGKVARATWRVAAPGMRDLFVNGVRITSTALPPWTPYAKRVLEETFDVTSAIRAGAENTLSVDIGNGWFNPLPLRMWYHYNLREELAVGTPCVRATLEIAYADGSRDEVVTDATWRAFEGRVIHNNLYLGVVEDARRAERETGPARIVPGPRGKVTPAGDFPKTVVYARRQARSVAAVTNGAWLVDFGANATGTLRVRLRNVKAGQKVAFRAGERIWPDGTLNPLSAVAGQIKKPERGPLFAVAEQRDTIICPDAAECVFEPRFTFHVFRYVQVEGLAEAPRKEDFEALDWSADVRDSASFTCSSAKVNLLHEVCRRTFRSNMQSVQSDCPGREKYGYSGDISCTAESLFCNYAMGPFYRKVVRDFLDEAEDDGAITETAPFVGIAAHPALPSKDGRRSRAAPIGWATGLPVLLDAMVRYAGDIDTLREAYPALVRYIGMLEKAWPDNRVPTCLGDWIPVKGFKADENLTGIAHYHQFVSLTAKFARLLNRPADAARLTARAESIAKTWRSLFLKGDGLVGRGVQAEQAFALYHGLLTPEEIPAARARLVADIDARGDSLTTGIFGTQYLLEWLSSHGDAARAGRIVTHDGYPGWFGMLNAGATTLLEDWNDANCVNVHSNCHPMFGSCEQWFMRHVLGIAVAEDAVGCDRVHIKPHAVGGITSASGHLDTPKGRISVAWKLVNGQMHVEQTVPPGVAVVDWSSRGLR